MQILRHLHHLDGRAAAAPPQVVGADGRPEYEVQELLKFKTEMRSGWGRPYLLMRWPAAGRGTMRRAIRGQLRTMRRATRGSRLTT